MITLKEKNFNKNTIEYYKYVNSYDFSCHACPCCGAIGSLIKHGFYARRVKINNEIEDLNVLRVKCKHCGKTHAVLPSFVVSYILTSVDDAIMIINDQTDISKCYSTKRLLKRSYKKWVNQILSIFDNIKSALCDLHALVIQCSKRFKLCFLQNHRGNYFCL